MRHKLIYWVIPFSIVAIGLLPKALPLDIVHSSAIGSEEQVNLPQDSIPHDNRSGSSIQQSLTSLSDRDMFGSNIASEVPVVKADTTETETWSDFEYQLVGVTKSNGRRIALFVEPNSQKKTNLRRGEVLEGWTITKVLSSRVELTREDQKLWVELFKPEGK